MTPVEIAKVQVYLRKAFSNNLIKVIPPQKSSGPVEVQIGGEFIGVLHRDDDEGEVSYSLLMSILEEDLTSDLIN